MACLPHDAHVVLGRAALAQGKTDEGKTHLLQAGRVTGGGSLTSFGPNMSLVAGSTRAPIVFLSNYGTAYTARIIDIPATTGYGEPIQKLFKLKDGEKIVSAISMDDRVLVPKTTAIDEKHPDAAPKVHGLAVTSDDDHDLNRLRALRERRVDRGGQVRPALLGVAGNDDADLVRHPLSLLRSGRGGLRVDLRQRLDGRQRLADRGGGVA